LTIHRHGITLFPLSHRGSVGRFKGERMLQTALVFSLIPLAAAGAAKLLAPYANAPLFESILLRLPLLRNLRPFVAIRLLATAELVVAAGLVFGSSPLATVAIVLSVGMYAAFTYAIWLGFQRRLPCPCFGLQSDRPVNVCRAAATSAAFLGSLYLLRQVITAGTGFLAVRHLQFFYGAAVVAGIITAIAAWTQLKAEVAELTEAPKESEAQDSPLEGPLAHSMSRRSVLGGLPMLAVGAMATTLPRRLLGQQRPHSARHQMTQADASGVREFANVKRLLSRVRMTADEVVWRDAHSTTVDAGEFGKIKYFIIPLAGGLATTKSLMVAPRTGQGHAAALYDLADKSAVVAVQNEGWIEFAEGKMRPSGLEGFPNHIVLGCADCADYATLCCAVSAICFPECCTACGASGLACCSVHKLCNPGTGAPPQPPQ
jgi:hypothetical protein